MVSGVLSKIMLLDDCFRNLFDRSAEVYLEP